MLMKLASSWQEKFVKFFTYSPGLIFPFKNSDGSGYQKMDFGMAEREDLPGSGNETRPRPQAFSADSHRVVLILRRIESVVLAFERFYGDAGSAGILAHDDVGVP
jgi:hypothetical protein